MMIEMMNDLILDKHPTVYAWQVFYMSDVFSGTVTTSVHDIW